MIVTFLFRGFWDSLDTCGWKTMFLNWNLSGRNMVRIDSQLEKALLEDLCLRNDTVSLFTCLLSLFKKKNKKAPRELLQLHCLGHSLEQGYEEILFLNWSKRFPTPTEKDLCGVWTHVFEKLAKPIPRSKSFRTYKIVYRNNHQLKTRVAHPVWIYLATKGRNKKWYKRAQGPLICIVRGLLRAQWKSTRSLGSFHPSVFHSDCFCEIFSTLKIKDQVLWLRYYSHLFQNPHLERNLPLHGLKSFVLEWNYWKLNNF